MTLIELSSADALAETLASTPATCVTFSAHWCGPCKASKPQLEQMAKEYANIMKMVIVYESDIGEAIHHYQIRAFPTYVLYVGEKEQKRVEGANLAAVKEMIDNAKVSPQWSATKGATLGGSEVAVLTPEEARLLRLSKLGGGVTAAETTKPVAPEPMDTEDMKEPSTDDTKDVEMEVEKAPTCTEVVDPTAKLDKQLLETLTEAMGFTLLRAQKGLLYGNGGTVEGAVEWLMVHQDDLDIDEPIPANAGVVAQSYKCNECGKILSNMANLELHANKTGHSDFEESTEKVKPLSEDEKAAKILEIKELLKAKRAEREEAEKVDETERERQRRNMGKEMVKTREQMDAEQRKREAIVRKREKEAFKRERQRLREELAKDKAERQANAGKLSSKLGVEGYNPDGVQYDIQTAAEAEAEGDDKPKLQAVNKKAKVDPSKVDSYIAKVSQYRAGGDGGKCLKVLKAYVGNVVDNPAESKFKTINMENNAFKTKVKPFIGAKALLIAVGFEEPDNQPGVLVLNEPADYELLASVKSKLEAALAAYG